MPTVFSQLLSFLSPSSSELCQLPRPWQTSQFNYSFRCPQICLYVSELVSQFRAWMVCVPWPSAVLSLASCLWLEHPFPLPQMQGQP